MCGVVLVSYLLIGILFPKIRKVNFLWKGSKTCFYAVFDILIMLKKSFLNGTKGGEEGGGERVNLSE